jgi:hypothetical protein
MARVSNSYSSASGSSITVVANYSALPDPTTVSGKFYWAEASQGTSWLPGSLGGTYYNSGMYYSNGVSWSFVNVPYQATQAEVDAGTNNDKFVTPKTLKDNIDTTIIDGSTNPVDGNAVFDGLAEKVNKSRFVFQPKTSITGVTGESDICSFKIDGGAYENTDSLKLAIGILKSTTASAVTYTVYIGTTANARTSTIARVITNAATRGIDIERSYFIDAGDFNCTAGFTANAFAGTATQNTAVNTPISVNMANDLWITITANPTVTTEVVGILGASITPRK